MMFCDRTSLPGTGSFYLQVAKRVLPRHQKRYRGQTLPGEAARAPDAQGPRRQQEGPGGRGRSEPKGEATGLADGAPEPGLEACLVAVTPENTLERPWEGTWRWPNDSNAFIL